MKDHCADCSSSVFGELKKFGWRFDPSLCLDRNFLNLASLVAMNSTCSDGHMGCVLVKGIDRGGGASMANSQSNGRYRDFPYQDPESAVVLCAVNKSLFRDKITSDIHAEANAVATAARCGTSLDGCSLYVTMPPCKNCYKLVYTAGVRRIVTRRDCLSEELVHHMTEVGLEFVKMVETPEILRSLEATYLPHLDKSYIQQERRRRKEIKAAIKEESSKRRKRSEHADSNIPPISQA